MIGTKTPRHAGHTEMQMAGKGNVNSGRLLIFALNYLLILSSKKT
jgi:hypothetical protein